MNIQSNLHAQHPDLERHLLDVDQAVARQLIEPPLHGAPERDANKSICDASALAVSDKIEALHERLNNLLQTVLETTVKTKIALDHNAEVVERATEVIAEIDGAITTMERKYAA